MTVESVKFKWGTEAQILALLPTDAKWVNRAFYYPSDKSYFYQAVDGVTRKYGDGSGSGTGVKLNGSVLGGVKTYIQTNELLDIPEHHDYNTFSLKIDGDIKLGGQINFM